MSAERRNVLLRSMRRSLISMQVQTPEPIFLRVPTRLYFAVVTFLVIAVAAVSVQAAWTYQGNIKTLERKILHVKNTIADNKNRRKAALLAYHQRSREPIVSRQSPVAPTPEIPKSAEADAIVTVEKVAPARKENPPKKLVIRSQLAAVGPPVSMDDALYRMGKGRDDGALNWAIANWTLLRGSRRWESFKKWARSDPNAEHLYQLGMLLGASSFPEKSQNLLAAAVVLDPQARYIKALGIASDRLGEPGPALAAYRRYLRLMAPEKDSVVEARVALLERE